MDSVTDILHDNPAVTTGMAVVGTAAVAYITYRRARHRQAKPPVSAPPGTVILHQIPRATRAPSLSPFPLKLETFLRLAKVPYVVDHSSPMSSKGKTPWMTLDGKDVPDSQLCIRHLNQRFDLDLNKSLTSQQRAVARSVQVMVDEHLYWTFVYYRWVHDKEQTILRENFSLRLGYPVCDWLLWVFSGKVKKQLHGQGMGRHSAAEILHFMMDDLNTLQDQLGDQTYMMGADVTEVDCSVFGMLCQFIYHAEDAVMKDLVRDKFPKLLAYMERLKATVWPDWHDCLHNTSKDKKLA